MIIRFFFLLFTLFVPLATFAGAGSPDAVSECKGCHGTITSGKFLHSPVSQDNCAGCHRADTGNHPQVKGTHRTKAVEPALCFSCHDRTPYGREFRHSVVDSCSECHLVHSSASEHLLKSPATTETGSKSICCRCHPQFGAKKTVHSPVKQGSCTLCHLPHSSSFSGLLKATGSELCFRCHDRDPYTFDYQHQPAAEGKCDTCHFSHDSDTPKLLKMTGSTVICVNCHGSAYVSGASVHKPAQAGECRKCHAAHSARNRKLLLRPFPEELALPYDEENYAACFKCHTGSAFTQDNTSLTAFRRGSTNLHKRHVQKYSCKVCHEFHSSPQPKLMRMKAGGPSSNYSVSFVFTPGGGRCTTSCHAVREYSRD